MQNAAQQPDTSTVVEAQSKKRRRRVPPSGAAEDCHTCRRRGTECDRRRPYCSQCLGMGKDCSGYRTQLTWGVGVASRGKLRGMSLPVLNVDSKPPVTVATSKARTASAGSVATGQGPSKRQKIISFKSEPKEGPAIELKTEPTATEHCFATVRDRTTATQGPMHAQSLFPTENSWQMPAPPQPHLQQRASYEYTMFSPTAMDTPQFPTSGQFHSPGQFYHNPNARLSRTTSCDATAISSSAGSSRSATSMDNYFDASYSQQIQLPPTPVDDSIFIDPFLSHYGPAAFSTSPQLNTFHHSYSDGVSPILSGYEAQHIVPPHMKERSASSNSAPSQPVFETRSELSIIREESPVTLPFKNKPDDGDWHTSGLDCIPPESTMTSSSIPRSFTDMQVYGISPRMQYLLDYYDKLICPVLITLDGPMNPYRRHVFPLAMQSVGLQNAIAALVTNNMRMRNLPEVKRLADSNARKRRDSMESLSLSIRRPTPEEMHYKAQSVELLNSQLTDRSKARDDSILATLLILCLFHVCDSGFSKFKTQLAGVQKLLKMRGAVSTEFVGWVHMFFAWFDVMTSAVNDREAQINTDSLKCVEHASESMAAEQFSGCDGRLFKLIARLSRLNLLSQSRPVRDMSNVEPRPPPPRKYDGTGDISLLQFDHLDGNGWARPVVQNDPSAPDNRHTFWKEWKEIRDGLEAVQFQDLYSGMGASSLSIPEQDLVHISESFRYSALLYIERLARPLLPSASNNFANLVACAVSHIAQIGVNSCVTKFLLWPLFVIGSESVSESDQDLIRSKCVEIHRESGFFNNLSVLEVLERIWREGDINPYFNNDCGGTQVLRWSKAMNRVDGEYIVV